MPSYIELDKQATFPPSSNMGKIILGINTGGVLVLSDSNGNTAVAGAPTGNVGEIQYHSSSGYFGAVPTLTYDETTSTLSITGSFNGSGTGSFTGSFSENTATGIDLSGVGYTLTSPGIYEITTAVSNTLAFPDPLTMNGCRITVVNTDASNAITLETNGYQPYQIGSNTQYTTFEKEAYYELASIGGKWRGGCLAITIPN